MTVTLAPWHVGHESVLSGSIYAAAPGSRIEAARTLVAAGISVHVDIMAPDEGLPAGIGSDELAELADVVPVSMLGIHLIGSAAGVRRLLPTVPECGDLYLPIGIRDDRGCRLWAAVWDEFDITPPNTADLAGYHGVLVMLLEPGTSGAADPRRVDIARLFAAHGDVTVDGGVTPDLIPRCRSSGVTTLVVGRALLTEHSLPEGQS